MSKVQPIFRTIRELGADCLFDADYNKQYPGMRDDVTIEACIAAACHEELGTE